MGDNLRLSHGSGWRGGGDTNQEAPAPKLKRPKHHAKQHNENFSIFPKDHHEDVHAPSFVGNILSSIRPEWHRRCDEGDDELEGDDLRQMSRLISSRFIAWRASEEQRGQLQGGDIDKGLVRQLSKAFVESIDDQRLGSPSMTWAGFIEAWTKAATFWASSDIASLYLSRAREASKSFFGADGGARLGIDEAKLSNLYQYAVECAIMGKVAASRTDADDERPALVSSRACLSLLKPNRQGQGKGGILPPLPLAPRALAASLIGLSSLLTLSPKTMKDLSAAEELLVTASDVCDWAERMEAGPRFFPAEDVLPLDRNILDIKAMRKSAGEKRAMLLCQLGRDAEAATLLSSLGYIHRLSRNVLRYHIKHPPPFDDRSVLGESCRFVRAVDNALPTSKMLDTMRAAFDPYSPFWSEHGYHLSSPYFSYVHPLEPSSSSQSGLDLIIREIHSVACSLFPSAQEARFAEWWAHCRPHGSGHQLHFDSDNEGIGQVRNPIVSSVLYLTAEGLGGQTLCTNQAFSSAQLATRGWFVTPRVGRLAVFDGSFLHGVVPGRLGDDVEGDDAAEAKAKAEAEAEAEAEAGGRQERRVSFMVAFWRDIRPQPRSDGLPGASQPYHSDPKEPPPYGGVKEEVGLPGRGCFGPSLKLSWDHTWKKAFEGVGTESQMGTRENETREVCPLSVDQVFAELSGDSKLEAGRLPSYSECFQGF